VAEGRDGAAASESAAFPPRVVAQESPARLRCSHAGSAVVSAIERLIEIMARLRDPNGGCPWDLEQDFASIAPYTLEEAYEVDDAIRRGDMKGLADELGDLLLQVVFHARMAEEGARVRRRRGERLRGADGELGGDQGGGAR
jgi:NTP pyrophosphatase (non-canonical NTP hydrolase)